MELFPPVTRLRRSWFARNVFSLKRSYYGVNPTRDTWFARNELLTPCCLKGFGSARAQSPRKVLLKGLQGGACTKPS